MAPCSTKTFDWWRFANFATAQLACKSRPWNFKLENGRGHEPKQWSVYHSTTLIRLGGEGPRFLWCLWRPLHCLQCARTCCRLQWHYWRYVQMVYSNQFVSLGIQQFHRYIYCPLRNSWFHRWLQFTCKYWIAHIESIGVELTMPVKGLWFGTIDRYYWPALTLLRIPSLSDDTSLVRKTIASCLTIVATRDKSVAMLYNVEQACNWNLLLKIWTTTIANITIIWTWTLSDRSSLIIRGRKFTSTRLNASSTLANCSRA